MQDSSIYLNLRPKLMAVAYAFFRNREDAEDIVQEVLLKLFKRGLKEGDDAEALAVRATKNACVSEWRKRRIRNVETLGAKHELLPALSKTDAAAEAGDRMAVLGRTISRLPRSEQRIIRLRQAELESEDISLITGISLRSVRTILSSARRHLIQMMEKEL